MAKKKADAVVRFEKPKVSRPNVHSKKKTSKLKTSKNYQKSYNKQGR